MKNIHHICQFFFMWIIAYKNKGSNFFFFFFENVKDFMLNYYVQHRNSKITKHLRMMNLLGFFGFPKKCFLWVLLGFVAWESEKLFYGVLTKNKIFFGYFLNSSISVRFIEKKFFAHPWTTGLNINNVIGFVTFVLIQLHYQSHRKQDN